MTSHSAAQPSPSSESTSQPVNRSTLLREILFVAAAVVVFLAQVLWSMRDLAPTFDEVAHIGAAADYIQRGEYVLNMEHPPLIKQLAGLALVPLHLRIRVPAPPGPQDTDVGAHYRQEQWDCGRVLLLSQSGGRGSAMKILTAARLPLLALSTLLLPIIYLWGRAMLGRAGGLAALVLLAFCPTWLAHAPLVHTDAAVTMFSAAALAWTWRLQRRFSWLGAAGLGVLCGLALCTKYSALLLGPMVAAAVLGGIVLAPAGERARLLGRWLVAGAAITTCAAVPVVFCTGRFEPRWWLAGYGTLFEGHRSGFPAYLAGSFRPGGFWSYYLMAMAVKMTLGALALIAVGFGLLWQLDASRRRDLIVSVLLPAAVFFAGMLTVRVQLGIRHALPLFPLLFLIAGAGVQVCWERGGLARGAAIALLALHAGASLWRAPNYIGFFNLAAGGPHHGWQWLDDSNVDWGQDLPALVRWSQGLRVREPGAVIALDHFGSIAPWEWSEEFAEPDVDAWLRQALPDWNYLAISPHLLVREAYIFNTNFGGGYPWAEAQRIHGWIETGYAVFHLRPADDGSGDVVIEGASPERISRDAWVRSAHRRADGIALRLGPQDLLGLATLRWQQARFDAMWADPETLRASWEAVDRHLMELRRLAPEALAELSPALFQERRAHWASQGQEGRSEFFSR